MSLLPIIYTSLLITGGFLLVIIAISYLTYKLRGDKEPLVSKTNILEPIRIPGQPRRNNYEQIVYRTKALRPPEKPKKKPVKTDPIKKAPLKPKIVQREEIFGEKKRVSSNPHQSKRSTSSKQRAANSKRELRKNRIQIMNDTKYFTKNATEHGEKYDKEKRKTVLPKVDILAFYSEETQPLAKLGN